MRPSSVRFTLRRMMVAVAFVGGFLAACGVRLRGLDAPYLYFRSARFPASNRDAHIIPPPFSQFLLTMHGPSC
jgi:hypothetical protein